jgi:hypothetical protein
MPARTKLGDQYVRFTVEGLPEAEKAVDKTTKKVASSWSGMALQATKVGGGIKNAFAAAGDWVQKKLGSIGASAIKLGAPAAGVTALAMSSVAGTREGDLLATAWQYVARVFGNILAPAIRVATTLLVRFGDFIGGLSPETKGWIATLMVAGTALVALGGFALAFGGMFSGAMGLVSAGIGLATAAVTVGLAIMDAGWALMGTTAAAAWLAALGPVALVIAGIAAVGLAIVAMVTAVKIGALAMEDGMLHSSKSWIGYLIQGVKLLTMVFVDFWNFMQRHIRDTLAMFAGLAKSIEKVTGSTALTRGIQGAAEAFIKNTGQIDRDKVKGFFDDAEHWADRNVPSVSNLAKGMKEAWKFGKELPGMLKGLFQSGGEMQLHPSFPVKFEGLAQSFDRLQEAFASGTPQDNLIQIRDNGKETNDKLDKIFERLGNIGGAVVGP